MSPEQPTFRRFDRERDADDVATIWRECGWLPTDRGFERMEPLLEGATSWVAEISGRAECLVVTNPGDVRHDRTTLPFVLVDAVTTSRIARKQGLARKLTAHALKHWADAGVHVAGLGTFDRGFYDALGFGNGPHEVMLRFDPATLRVPRPRIPVRLTIDDWEAVHAARLRRMRRHGSCNITSPGVTLADLHHIKNGFGLGYRDDRGEISHLMWLGADDVGEGPYVVHWWAFRDRDDLLELLGLLRNLGDQVRLVRLIEPPWLHLEDLLDRPFRRRAVSRKGKFETGGATYAFWQMRICNLSAAIGRSQFAGGPIRFNLDIHDPVEQHLPSSGRDDDEEWRGCTGRYIVTLGPESTAQAGADPTLPTVSCSIGAFTRLWLGVLPASGLAVTDGLDGPAMLLRQLEDVIRLPRPSPCWDF